MPKLIIANWKANFNVRTARQWVNEFATHRPKSLTPEPAYEWVVCPPFPLLDTLAPHADQLFALGVQDLSEFGAGAYTGAVSAANLVDWPIRYAILGHSERRHYWHEDHQQVARKVTAALDAGYTPIVCVDQPDFAAQAAQINPQDYARLVIAYEPVHAISTFGGQEDPIATTLAAVDQLHDIFGDRTRVLYGGSVSPQNALTYLQPESIAGVLVGSTSLHAAQFAQLAGEKFPS